MKRLPKLMYAVGSRVIARTGHALERVGREFRHFQVRKYGFASLDSAKDQIGLFMIGYTLEQMYNTNARLKCSIKLHPVRPEPVEACPELAEGGESSAKGSSFD